VLDKLLIFYFLSVRRYLGRMLKRKIKWYVKEVLRCLDIIVLTMG
jgi:hypothetical protein